MIVTTTDSIDGKSVAKHLGIVAGEAIMGANLFKDLFAGIRDLVGGRSQAYEEELTKARNLALEEMKEQAKSLGANAVIGGWYWLSSSGRKK